VENAPQVGAGSRPRLESEWTSLYRVAGIAAAVAALLTPITIGVFIAWPPPYGGSADEWFRLYQDNPLLGLMSLDLGFVVINVVMIPIVLGLYVALRRRSPSWMLFAAGLFFVGVAGFFASNPSIEMLSLSDKARIAGESQQVALAGAGEALLATFEGTAFHVNYILGQTAGILIGLVMFRAGVFSKATARLMIAGNALGFGLYVPVVGLPLSAFSGVVLWVWFLVVSRGFFRLARSQTI